VIGDHVRELREGRGLSLRQLAARAGVSAPMLSQVERGETSPTLAVAEKIADGLELSLSQLLRLVEAPPLSVQRAGARSRHGSAGHAWELLSPDLVGGRMAVSRHELAAGAATGDAPIHEPGSREWALVESGALELRLDGARHALAAGDSVSFDADLEHRFCNMGDAPAVFLSVVTSGLRRS
jgi:transcriptional regulator with XRE-family HTH domain